jgi:hypothetical protein
MTNVHDLACAHARRRRPLIDYALHEGWAVERTADGHLKFVKPGLPPIYTSASDYRSAHSGRAQALLHGERQASVIARQPVEGGCRDD